MPDDTVTLALLSQKLDVIQAQLAEYEARQLDRINDHEDRLRGLERDITVLGGRVTIWQGVQAAFTAAATTVAVLVGRRGMP